jgi:DNA-binding GntR family transcriptional regulator
LLVAGGDRKSEVDRKDLEDHLRDLLGTKTLSLSDTVKEVAKEYGVSRKVVYEAALRLEREK